MTASPPRTPLPYPLLAVAAGTVGFGAINIANARALAPNWGQDLAFFHQIVHSAAHGGPWASPLLLEPQGFLEMVHTHLVLPLVVAVYWLIPRQEVLLLAQAGFVSLALWPAWRLAEGVAGGRVSARLAPLVGPAAALGVALYGPFQAAATADFRPSVLFIPGLVGVFAWAWQRRWRGMVGWAAVAIAGRQEAVYLLGVAAVVLCCLPWGPAQETRIRAKVPGWWWARLRVREGMILAGVAAVGFAAFALVKPRMFNYFDPRAPAPEVPIPQDHVENRIVFAQTLARSGVVLGVLSPAPLVATAPMVREMVATGREWGPMVGPAAHYHAFWLPFALAAGIAGAGRLRWWGLGAFAVANATAFPMVELRTGPVGLRALSGLVEPSDRVAADYDTIHLFSGRAVLWNAAQLRMRADERPYGWTAPWPIPPTAVDVVVTHRADPLLERLVGWSEVGAHADHVVMRRPLEPGDAG